MTERVNAERERLGLAPVEANSVEAMDITAPGHAGGQAPPRRDRRPPGRLARRRQQPGSTRSAEVLGRAAAQPEAPDEHFHQRVTGELTEHASTFGRRDAVQGLAADATRGSRPPRCWRGSTPC